VFKSSNLQNFRIYPAGDVDKSAESSMTTINHFAKMENGFDLSGTREKMILSCSPNYRFTEFKFEHFYCVTAAHSPLLYYRSVSLLAGFFFSFNSYFFKGL